MTCPFCQHTKSKVTDSRPNDWSIRRRRRCFLCKKRWSTIETDIDRLVTLQKQVDQLEYNISEACDTFRRFLKSQNAT